MLLHIGYPKTATTWLQKNVFCDESLGFVTPWGTRAKPALDTFVFAPSFGFDPEAARGRFSAELHNAASKQQTAVLSDECLIGDPVQQRYWGAETLRRLHATFPGARVLVSIREQRSWIASAYGEYVRHGGHASIDYFLDQSPSYKRSFHKPPMFRWDVLEYDRLIAQLHGLWGRESVAVLPMELIKQDPADYVRRLLSFVGRPMPAAPPNYQSSSNASLGGRTTQLRLLLNRWWPRSANRPQPRLVGGLCVLHSKLWPRFDQQMAQRRLRERVDRHVGDHYAASNRRAGELIGIGLAALNYPI